VSEEHSLSEFSELIKKFDKIRDYMRDFYVYGFKSREGYDKKSLRSYDNEKRRIESYLSDYMSFRRDASGKNVFMSVDSSDIPANPLYRAFKAKSFTKNDITLNFLILDILQDGVKLSANEIADIIAGEYLTYFEEPVVLDLSTVRNKLSEYVDLGILQTEKDGKKLLYSLATINIDLTGLCDALTFFSEVSPLGVVGSFLLDKCDHENTYQSFKHHYIMHALESEVVGLLLQAIHNNQKVEITNHSPRSDKDIVLEIIPLKFLVSVQGGRRYLCAYNPRFRTILPYRLDYIKSVRTLEKALNFDMYQEKLEAILAYTWGTSFYNSKSLQWLKMTLHIPHNERFIVNRIEREGRHGKLKQIDETTYEYFIEVFDTMEMMPWVRTFIGRIISIESSYQEFVKTFYSDLDEMYNLYDRGGDDAI
jgi:DNA-binding transcriptional ArsR family regulator